MRVLVTGGAGYIGSHVVKALRRAGHPVAVYDSLVRGHRAAAAGAEFYQGDLVDRARLSRAVGRFRPEAVMHLAGLCLVGESVAQPDLYRRINVGGSQVLIEEVVRGGVQFVVFSSSAAVYGNPLTTPVDEESPISPVNPYGETKAEVERLLQRAAEVDRLRVVSLRYFNAAGAEPDGDLGEDHDPETHLLPLIFRALTGVVREIVVHGCDYPTPDGTCVRDYVHTSDVAQAHLVALASLAQGDASGSFRAYNVGAGRGHSVLEVIRMAELVSGRSVPSRFGPRRPGDPSVLVASAERIRQELGWMPQWSDLETMVHTAWAWHKDHPRGYAHTAAVGQT